MKYTNLTLWVLYYYAYIESFDAVILVILETFELACTSV